MMLENSRRVIDSAIRVQNIAHFGFGIKMSFERSTDIYLFDFSPEALGARIEAVRIQHRKTQADIAKVLQISLRSYHHYARGTKVCPTPTIAKLAQAYHLDLNWLIHGIEAVHSAHDVQDLENFRNLLVTYLATAGIKMQEHKRKAIIGCWFQYRSTRLHHIQNDVVFWVDLMR